MKYQRIMMKLSGGAMSGEGGWGFDPPVINHIADEILQLHREGIRVAVMVGGGNISRASWPIPGGLDGPKRIT